MPRESIKSQSARVMGGTSSFQGGFQGSWGGGGGSGSSADNPPPTDLRNMKLTLGEKVISEGRVLLRLDQGYPGLICHESTHPIELYVRNDHPQYRQALNLPLGTVFHLTMDV